MPPRFRQLASGTDDGDDGIDIMTGVEVPDLSGLPIDLVGRSVPRCDCLVFTHRGPVSRVGDSYRGIYERWLPASDRRPALPFNFDRYPDSAGDPYAHSCVFEICVPVTRGRSSPSETCCRETRGDGSRALPLRLHDGSIMPPV